MLAEAETRQLLVAVGAETVAGLVVAKVDGTVLRRDHRLRAGRGLMAPASVESEGV